MRLKSFFVSLLFLFSFSSILRAGDVTVTPMSPGETAYFMSNLSKLAVAGNFYEGQSLVFYNMEGAVVSEKPINVPTKVTFDGTPGEGIDDVAIEDSKISFFPNPSSDFIHIVGLDRPTTAIIYNLNGQLIISTQDADINVSPLASGSYVLQVGSQCFKVIIQ